jgi:hypothetical protein
MKFPLLILALLLAGCSSPDQPEGVLVGTMKAYRTESGSFIIVSDQNGDSFEFEMNIHTAPRRKAK